MMLLMLAILFVTPIWADEDVTCGPDICNLVDCNPNLKSECKGIFLKKGGLCQCCDGCYDIIEPGQPCEILDYSKPPSGLCRPGFRCDNQHICSPYLK